MRVTAVRYGRTVSRDYQSRRAEYEVQVDVGESADEALTLCKALVAAALGEVPTQATVEGARALLKEVDAIEAALKRTTR